jgi:uncharacterized Rmd1/YagE family protein
MSTGTVAVEAFAISATLGWGAIDAVFDAGEERVKITKTHVVARLAGGGWAVAHKFGAIVFIGVDEKERKARLDRLLASVDEKRAPFRESFLIEIAPDKTPSALFDRVRVVELSLREIELVGLVIGQSVAMEYYEEDVDGLVAQILTMSRALASTARFHSKGNNLLRFIGRGMETRNLVVGTLSLLDAPSSVWDSEVLDRLYRELRAAFAIEERYRALDHKLDMIQDNLALFVDLTRHRASLAMEIIVILLIAGELILLLLPGKH